MSTGLQFAIVNTFYISLWKLYSNYWTTNWPGRECDVCTIYSGTSPDFAFMLVSLCLLKGRQSVGTDWNVDLLSNCLPLWIHKQQWQSVSLSLRPEQTRSLGYCWFDPTYLAFQCFSSSLHAQWTAVWPLLIQLIFIGLYQSFSTAGVVCEKFLPVRKMCTANCLFFSTTVAKRFQRQKNEKYQSHSFLQFL
jgi:hypothetical protein